MGSELDAAIRARLDWAADDPHAFGMGPIDVVGAVLDLHQPEQVGTLTPWNLRCVECSMRGVTHIDWPCPTVRKIAEKLGMEVPGE